MNDYQKYKFFRFMAIICGVVALGLWFIYFINL